MDKSAALTTCHTCLGTGFFIFDGCLFFRPFTPHNLSTQAVGRLILLVEQKFHLYLSEFCFGICS